MLERINQIAEQAATNVSRRQFLGGFGRTAAGAAAALGGLLVFSDFAKGGRKPRIPCASASSSACINHYVGDQCASSKSSKCKVWEGTENSCYCFHSRTGGGGGGGRRR